MPTLTYKFPYSINSTLVLSPSELDSIYLFGIDFRDELGNRYSDENKKYQIGNAQKEVENYLNIKLTPQIISEEFDYNSRDYQQWNYIRTSFPIEKAFSLIGYIGSQRQVVYPAEWLSTRSSNNKDTGFNRAVFLVPGGNTGATYSYSNIYTSLYPFFGYGQSNIPNYFTLEYCTPVYSKIPRDIVDAIGKLAAINVMNILGDISSIGAGIASQSIGIDGLSQSINTTQSAENNALSARVRMYINELKQALPNLRSRYLGIVFSSL